MLTPVQVDSSEVTTTGKQGAEEVIDIDLDDPEVANAAAKIQAGFRKKARKSDQQKVQILLAIYACPF
jgi:DNA primase catalytic subunit